LLKYTEFTVCLLVRYTYIISLTGGNLRLYRVFSVLDRVEKWLMKCTIGRCFTRHGVLQYLGEGTIETLLMYETLWSIYSIFGPIIAAIVAIFHRHARLVISALYIHVQFNVGKKQPTLHNNIRTNLEFTNIEWRFYLHWI